jgi:NAD(P)H-hydrate epimerase
MGTDYELVERPPALPERAEDGNKGSFGLMLVVGGNEEMIGAPVLAGMAGLRAGAGLVQVAMPLAVLPAGLSVCPELVGMGLGAGMKETRGLRAAAEKADAVVVGPGLGQSSDARQRLKALVTIREKAMVVDADGLNILARLEEWPAAVFKSRAVLTPHPGEMRRLARLLPAEMAGGWVGAVDAPIPSDDASRISIARLAAGWFAQVVVLKGHRTVVTDGRRVYINTTGDSTLAKAGTGDVLSGIIGSLMGQGLRPFEAACLGAWIHGKAGELAGAKYGKRSALAREVVGEIGAAIAEFA